MKKYFIILTLLVTIILIIFKTSSASIFIRPDKILYKITFSGDISYIEKEDFSQSFINLLKNLPNYYKGKIIDASTISSVNLVPYVLLDNSKMTSYFQQNGYHMIAYMFIYKSPDKIYDVKINLINLYNDLQIPTFSITKRDEPAAIIKTISLDINLYGGVAKPTNRYFGYYFRINKIKHMNNN